MADTSLIFDILGHDKSASRTFRQVAKEIDGTASSAKRLTADTAKLSAASERMARSQMEAGLAVRKAGLAAESAAERAANAQKRAGEAAEKLARGEITEEQAAKAAARAAKALERAEIAQASAQLAAAKAADQQADQLRKLATQTRQAELAQIAEDLTLLKAGGRRKAHNALLANSRKEYGELRGVTSGAFREMESLGGKALGVISKGSAKATAQLAEMGPMGIVPIAVGIAALPALATAAGAAMTLGLGGAVLALPLKVAAANAKVKASYTDLKKHVAAEMTNLSQPLVPVLEHSLTEAGKLFDNLRPHVSSAVATMAPALDRFVARGAASLEKFGPVIDHVADEFGPLLDVVGAQLPGVADGIASGIDKIVNAAAGHEADIGRFVQSIGTLADDVGGLTSALADAQPFIDKFASIPDDPWSFVKDASPVLNGLSGMFDLVTGSGDSATTSFINFGSSAQQAAAKTKQVTASVYDFNTAMKSLQHTLDLWNDKTRLKAAMADLHEAFRKAKGDYSGNTEASRRLRDALSNEIGALKSWGEHMSKGGELSNAMKAKIAAALPTLYTMAGRSKEARGAVDALARQFGIAGLGALAAKGKIAQLREEIAMLKGKTIVIHVKGTSRTGLPSFSQAASSELHGGRTGGRVGSIARYGSGGRISGPGTGTSDSILAMTETGSPLLVSNKEFVVNAKDTEQNLGLLQLINAGRVQAFAGGGQVKAKTSAVSSLTGKLKLSTLEDLSKVQALFTSLDATLKKFLSGAHEKRMLAWSNRVEHSMISLTKRYEKLAATIKDAKDFAATTKASGQQFASITGLDFGGAPVTASGAAHRLTFKLQSLASFAANIKTLAKRGLSKTMLRQIIEAGPEAAGQMAQALASTSGSQLSQLNSIQSQIDKTAGVLGNTAADALYDSGKKAGQGFLAGLYGQEKDIEKAMIKLAHSMSKAIKHALGIHSPSRVMAELGGHTAAGMAVGILGGIPRVEAAALRLAGATVPARPVMLPAGARGGDGASAQPFVVVLKIGERDLGEIIIDPLRRAVDARGGNVQAAIGR